MGQKTPSFTLRESLDVLDEALRLIDKPEKWTTGQWKCEVYEVDKKSGQYVYEKGNRVQAKDEKGRPLFAYCIEGAVNQAVINKFGPVRACEVGALNHLVPKGEEVKNDDMDGGKACNLLSVNDIALELYDTEWFEDNYGEVLADTDRPAQMVNDEAASYDMVINILKTRRQRVAEALRRKVSTA